MGKVKMPLREAQDHIEGKVVARMIIEFHDQFCEVYPHAVLVSDLCAVGPLQAMIGLAIAQGRLSLPREPSDA